MTQATYTVRCLRRDEMNTALDWAAAEGWNPGLDDADCFHSADPGGFLVGLLGDQPVSTISVVRYGASFGFLGFYIVRPGFRGLGLGLKIWNAGMARLAGRNVGLDGVLAQQENYQKSGFKLAWRNVRYQGIGGQSTSVDPDIVALSTRPLAEVAAYDQAFFPDDRRAFLQCWIAQPHSSALGLLHKGRLVGYGVLRVCRAGCKLGPLFADSTEGAERLFLALRAQAPQGAPIWLDTPQPNQAALDLAQRHGMAPVFETARMYTSASQQLPMQRMFGITSFELG